MTRGGGKSPERKRRGLYMQLQSLEFKENAENSSPKLEVKNVRKLIAINVAAKQFVNGELPKIRSALAARPIVKVGNRKKDERCTHPQKAANIAETKRPRSYSHYK